MTGRFIDGITQCQQACRETKTYEKFPDDPRARDLLLIQRDHYLMDPEVRAGNFRSPLTLLTSFSFLQQQDERIQLDKLDTVREDDHADEPVRPTPIRYHSRESPQHGKEGPLRRIFFW